MQNINNRIQISGKAYIRANKAELQYHSPLCSMQCPGSCHSDTWSTCTTLSLCTGLPWKPNSKSAGSRSLLALCETVAGINTAVRHCLIGFFCTSVLNDSFQPAFTSSPHLLEKGTRRKRGKQWGSAHGSWYSNTDTRLGLQNYAFVFYLQSAYKTAKAWN